MANGLIFLFHGIAGTRFGSKENARTMLEDGVTLIRNLKKPCAISANNITIADWDHPPDGDWMKASQLS